MNNMNTMAMARTCTVLVPVEAEAREPLDLRIEISGPDEVLAKPQTVEIRSADDTQVTELTLGGTNASPAAMDFALTAPEAPGHHHFIARLKPVTVGDAEYPQIDVPFSLDVADHRIAVEVFHLPNGVSPGEDFKLKIGASCGARSCGDVLLKAVIRGADGQVAAEHSIGSDIWPGTDGLRYTEVTLTAPDALGPTSWDVTVEADGASAHEPGHRRFSLRVSPSADALLKVTATDAETGDPVPGLKVVVGPFRTVTGEGGTAELPVSRGDHSVFVSGRKYIPYREDCTIDDELSLHVSLEPDTGLTDHMVWG